MKRLNIVQRKNSKIENQGLSLIELVVTIAIMAILVGLVSLSVGVLTGKQAKQCRDELASKLESVRALTMGKESVIANLFQDDTGAYVLRVTSKKNSEDTSPTVTDVILPSSKCTISYSLQEDGATKTELTYSGDPDDNGIKLEFDRASGALKKDNSGVCVYHIYVTQGNKSFGLRIYQETGKIVLE